MVSHLLIASWSVSSDVSVNALKRFLGSKTNSCCSGPWSVPHVLLVVMAVAHEVYPTCYRLWWQWPMKCTPCVTCCDGSGSWSVPYVLQVVMAVTHEVYPLCYRSWWQWPMKCTPCVTGRDGTDPCNVPHVLQVVMAVAQLYHHCAPRSEVALVAKALVRLLRGHK